MILDGTVGARVLNDIGQMRTIKIAAEVLMKDERLRNNGGYTVTG